MRRWISCAFFGLLLVPGWAANPPSFTCVANAGVPPILRSEGMTELTGDILLSCSGGTLIPAGQVIPTGAVSVALNTQVTSRLINHTGQSEAVLLIDEPGSATNPAPLTLCTKPGGCPVISNGTGHNNFSGTTNHPNVFSGVVAGNQVTFQGIPILAPVTSGAIRIYRITNIRANVAGLSPGGNQASIGQFTVPPVLASPSITLSSGIQAPIINGSSPSNPHGPLVVGFPTQGSSLQFGYNPTTVTATQTPFTIFLGAQGNGPTAFQALSPESNDTDPFAVSPTTTIPAPHGFESGTVIPNPFGGPPIGAADHGTILQLSVIAPPGVSASIPSLVPLGAGSLLWSAPNAVRSGSNVTVTADAMGSIEFFGLVAQSPGVTSSTGFNMPVIIDGTFPQVPFNIQAPHSLSNRPSTSDGHRPCVLGRGHLPAHGHQRIRVPIGSTYSSTRTPRPLPQVELQPECPAGRLHDRHHC